MGTNCDLGGGGGECLEGVVSLGDCPREVNCWREMFERVVGENCLDYRGGWGECGNTV